MRIRGQRSTHGRQLWRPYGLVIPLSLNPIETAAWFSRAFERESGAQGAPP